MDSTSPTPSTANPPVIIDPEPFAELNGPDARCLLDTIDNLRSLGVGDLVHLPQIIVIGDQSSGKSSVLEAISRVRFPIDGDLCTRFATELVLRRAEENTAKVSIQFADSGDASHKPFLRNGFNKNALPDIIQEAKEAMGIARYGTKRFSKDILRVEVAGPDVYPLTLVDLPGIFHSATAEQSTADKAIVDELVESYMAQPKSIILAVVAANNQLANQKVLQKAKEHDSKRERTIAVITKPDMAGHGSANEKKYLDLARNRESMHKLALGWYVLRNRSEEERQSETEVRDTVEERFFRSGEWSAINRANRGVESLRKRLSKVLLDHIKKNLPDLIQDIENNLWARQHELDRLGESRSGLDELRSYLLGIADEYQRLARDAVAGRYNDAFFQDADGAELARLRAALRNMNSAFEVVMSKKGAQYELVDDEASDEEDPEDNNDFSILQQLIDCFNVPDSQRKSRSDLNAELQSRALLSRGRELPGDTNPELVFELFKEQVTPWQNIAQQHLENVLMVAKVFVERVFHHVIGGDRATLSAILSGCVDPFFEKRKDVLLEKLQELLRPYTGGYVLPLDEEFRASMAKKSDQRVAARLAARLEPQQPTLFQPNPNPLQGVSRQQIISAVRDLESPKKDRFDTDGVIDRMEVYYEMSLRTFIDNVINLAVETCLVYDIPNILTTKEVAAMSADKLTELAAESEDVQKQRQDLQCEVEILREGLQECQKHKTRELTELPATLARMSLGAVELGRPPSRTVSPRPSPAPTASEPATSSGKGKATDASGNTSTDSLTNGDAPLTQATAPSTFGFSTPLNPSKTNPSPSLFGNPQAGISANQPSDKTAKRTTLRVGNLDQNVTANMLRETFRSMSGVLRARLAITNPFGRSRGFGYVDFDSLKNAKKALEAKNGAFLGSREINIKYASVFDESVETVNAGELRYPGMEAVPLLTNEEEYPWVEIDDQYFGRQRFVHVGSLEEMEGWSTHELRLRWMVEQGV